MPDTTTDTTTEELLRLEQERCAAISRGDLAALERLLSDDLTHTHSTGRTEDKEAYLEGLGGRARETTRHDLRVRVYGDTAVINGMLRNTFPPSEPGAEPRVLELQAIQVWVKQPDGWKQVAFQSSGQLPPRN